MKKLLLTLLVLAVLLSLGFVALNQYIYNQKQAPSNLENIDRYRGTLTGEYLCLPPVNQNDPQTLECALGIKTDSGEYYALDFTAMSQTPPTLVAGDRFSASGVITPIELLSTDHWQKYPVIGIFSVTDSVKKLSD